MKENGQEKHIAELQKKINYTFQDPALIQEALRHSSYVKEHDRNGRSNERLEFLGDAFFDAIIGEELFRIFSQREEGFLSRSRATIVCEKSLAHEARRIGLGEYLLVGNGEEKNGGRQRESILADALEAVIGAVYLDGGFGAVREVVLGLFHETIENAAHGKYMVHDYKTRLQERLQARGITSIRYEMIREEGPDHDKTFTVRLLTNEQPQTEGTGKSKKQAEQQAAQKMLERES